MTQYERSNNSTSLPGMANPANALAAMQGVADSMITANMEVAGFISQRTRAQMELSKQFVACRTAAEVGQLGGQFWHEALHDLTQFNARMMAVWIQGMTSAGQGGVARQTAQFVGRATQPMTEAGEDAVLRTAETVAEPWPWWRTDMKGLRAQHNGSPSAGS